MPPNIVYCEPRKISIRCLAAPPSASQAWDEKTYQDHADRKKETSSRSGNTAQRTRDSAATGQKHRSNQDIGHEAEDQKDNMGNNAISCLDDFEKCVSIWCASLESALGVSGRSKREFSSMVMESLCGNILDGQCSKEQDLHGCSRSIPERSRNTIRISNPR